MRNNLIKSVVVTAMVSVFTSYAAIADDAGAVSVISLNGKGKVEVLDTSLPVVSVRGEGKVEVAPDEVVLVIEAYTEHTKPEEAKRINSEKVATILKIAKKHKINDKKIRALHTNLQQRYEYRNSRREFIGYSAATSVEIVSEDVENYDKILNEMVEKGIDRISSVSFRLSNPREIERDAMVKAAKNAKDKAKALADILDIDLGKPISVLESGTLHTHPKPVPYIRAMSSAESIAGAAAHGGVPASLPGLIKVVRQVDIAFEIKKKKDK